MSDVETGTSEAGPTGAPPPVEFRIRWRWIIVCALAGIIGLLIAWCLSRAGNEFGENVAINVSTSFLLAGALFLLERAFVVHTQAAVRDQAEQVAAAVAQEVVRDVAQEAADVVRQVSQLDDRVSDLEGQVADRWEGQRRAQDARLSAMDDSTAFDATAGALAMAQQINAIGRELVVPAGPSVDSPRIGVEFTQHEGDEDELTLRLVDTGPTTLIERFAHIASVPSAPSATWEVGAELADVIHTLRTEMVAAGYGTISHEVQPVYLMGVLNRILKDAVVARRGEPTRWLTGETVCELVAEDWVVSNAGLEVKGHGIVAGRSNVYETVEQMGGPFEVTGPPPPSWVEDRELWQFALTRVVAPRRR